MDCRKIRKYLYAFADGQLDVKENCELLDHLKMCPACTRVVDEHQALRKALGRMVGSIPVPAGLASSVRKQFVAKRPVRRSGYDWRRVVPAAVIAAACALFATHTAWQFFRPGPSMRFTAPPKLGKRLARLVVGLHNRCCFQRDGHHRSDLSLNVDSLDNEISEHIARHCGCELLAYAPDLSAHGYRVESANFCGIKGAPLGGHIVYAHDDNSSMFSVMSVPNFSWAQQCGQDAPDDSKWFKESVTQPGGPRLQVLAWREGDNAYFFCGLESHDKMLEMVVEVQALASRPEARAIFASHLSRH